MFRVLLIGLVVAFSSLAHAEDDKVKTRALYYNMTPAFVSNFGPLQRKLSYVKAEVSLKVGSEGLLEKIVHNEAMLRHEIVMLLSSQSKENMESHDAQEALRVAALGKVKEVLAKELGTTGVEDLLFTSFVIQI